MRLVTTSIVTSLTLAGSAFAVTGARSTIIDSSVNANPAPAVESSEGLLFTEQFETGLPTATSNQATLTPINLSSGTWQAINRSAAIGSTGVFSGPNASGTPPVLGPFLPAAGNGSLYAAMNFNNGAGTATISTWLMSPVITLQNGDTIAFQTRQPNWGVPPSSLNTFPDRLEIRVSGAGASTDVGTGATGVGDFSNLLFTVNPTLALTGYPQTWTEYTATVSGLAAPVSGRFAFRYFVTSGGPSGANSNFIGIDNVRYNAIPEPATLAALAGAGLLALRRRGK